MINLSAVYQGARSLVYEHSQTIPHMHPAHGALSQPTFYTTDIECRAFRIQAMSSALIRASVSGDVNDAT